MQNSVQWTLTILALSLSTSFWVGVCSTLQAKCRSHARRCNKFSMLHLFNMQVLQWLHQFSMLRLCSMPVPQ